MVRKCQRRCQGKPAFRACGQKLHPRRVWLRGERWPGTREALGHPSTTKKKLQQMQLWCPHTPWSSEFSLSLQWANFHEAVTELWASLTLEPFWCSLLPHGVQMCPCSGISLHNPPGIPVSPQGEAWVGEGSKILL
jgi:hypothetical protein